jgi:lysophospholipase L1-like esterase
MKRALVGAVLAMLVVGLVAGPAGATSVSKARAKKRRPGPFRVLLVGDSITVNYEYAVEALLAPKGFQVIKAGIASSSLLDSGQCGGGVARGLVAYVDPDFVIAEYNGNYKNLEADGIRACKPEKAYGSTAWLRRWRNAALNNERAYGRRKAKFFWVLAPSIASFFQPKASVLPKINAIYRKLATDAPNKASAIDAWTAFGGATFDQSLRYDVQHLNAAGAAKIAPLVQTAIG